MYKYSDIKQHTVRRNYVAAGTEIESFTSELIKGETEREREREREQEREIAVDSEM